MISRRGFLSSLIGVPLAVKAYLSSAPAAVVPPVAPAPPPTPVIASGGGLEWIDFMITIDPPIVYRSLFSDETYVVEGLPSPPLFSATVIGWDEAIADSLRTRQPWRVELPNGFGAVDVEIDGFTKICPVDDVLRTEIQGRVVDGAVDLDRAQPA